MNYSAREFFEAVVASGLSTSGLGSNLDLAVRYCVVSLSILSLWWSDGTLGLGRGSPVYVRY